MTPPHVYEVRPRKDGRGRAQGVAAEGILMRRRIASSTLSRRGSFTGLAAGIESQTTTGESFSRSHDAVIRIYDETGNVIETHEHAGDFKEW
jgi:hypothetical protein